MMGRTRTWLIVLMMALAAGVLLSPAPAQDYDAPADEGGYVPERSGGQAALSVLDVAGKLVIVLAVACGVIRALRWWKDYRLNAGGEGRGGRHMWLEETLALGPEAQLHLVEVEGRRILLATTAGAVTHVAEVNEPAAVAPTAYRSVRKRADGSTDELNVVQAGVSTRAIRPDVVARDESWEQRRGRLLRELQEQR